MCVQRILPKAPMWPEVKIIAHHRYSVLKITLPNDAGHQHCTSYFFKKMIFDQVITGIYLCFSLRYKKLRYFHI